MAMNTVQWLRLAKAKIDNRPVLYELGVSGNKTVGADGYRLHMFDGILPVRTYGEYAFPGVAGVIAKTSKAHCVELSQDKVTIYGNRKNPTQLAYVILAEKVFLNPQFVIDVLAFNGCAKFYYGDYGSPVLVEVDEKHSAILMPIDEAVKTSDHEPITLRQYRLIQRMFTVKQIDWEFQYGDGLVGEAENEFLRMWNRRVNSVMMRINQQYRKAAQVATA